MEVRGHLMSLEANKWKLCIRGYLILGRIEATFMHGTFIAILRTRILLLLLWLGKRSPEMKLWKPYKHGYPKEEVMDTCLTCVDTSQWSKQFSRMKCPVQVVHSRGKYWWKLVSSEMNWSKPQCIFAFWLFRI